MRYIHIDFFQALNPTAKKSGISAYYDDHPHEHWAGNLDLASPHGVEIIDQTVRESISAAYHRNLGFFSGIKATYEIIKGNHFIPLTPKDEEDEEFSSQEDHPIKKSSKGVLDYLIFPLIARVIFYDDERRKAEDEQPSLIDTIAAAIALVAEVIRLSAGVALTIIVIPIIAITHIIRAFRGVNTDTDHSELSQSTKTNNSFANRA